MTQTEIEDTMYDMCREFGIPIFLRPNLPFKEIKDERIVIIVGDVQPSTFWENCFVKIDWCIPDYEGEANSPKVKRAEHCLKRLYRGVGKFKGVYYHYAKDSTGVYENTDMRCHYVNLTLLFQSQNLINHD